MPANANELVLDDESLRAAADQLLDAAAAPRGPRHLPMLNPQTSTAARVTIGAFMRAAEAAARAVADGAGETAASIAALISTSSELDAEIARLVGPRVLAPGAGG
ncbi:MAG: hypothetical protein KDB25_04625 [Leucobacter sp.]|nr:hypothetical protein [Leucobacter sp.]